MTNNEFFHRLPTIEVVGDRLAGAKLAIAITLSPMDNAEEEQWDGDPMVLDVNVWSHRLVEQVVSTPVPVVLNGKSQCAVEVTLAPDYNPSETVRIMVSIFLNGRHSGFFDYMF